MDSKFNGLETEEIFSSFYSDDGCIVENRNNRRIEDNTLNESVVQQTKFESSVTKFIALGSAGDFSAAIALVDRLTAEIGSSTFLSTRLQALLSEAVVERHGLPSSVLGALIQRFRWLDEGNALERYRPELHARVVERVSDSRRWLEVMRGVAQRLDDVGEAARLILRPRADGSGKAHLSPEGWHALERFAAEAVQHAPLLDGAIDPAWITPLKAENHHGDAARHVNVRGSTLPVGSRWCLSLAAMYTIVHGGTDATLEPFHVLQKEYSAAMLRDTWSITGVSPRIRHEQVINVLEWLLSSGHRKDPEFAPPDDSEIEHDLLAWDIARGAVVARHAFLADCITESEAWRYLRAFATMAQTSFDGWAEYGKCYLRGRTRWRGGPEEEIETAVDFLIRSPRSPWHTLDWDVPINEKTVHGELFGRWRRDPRVQRGVWGGVLGVLFIIAGNVWYTNIFSSPRLVSPYVPSSSVAGNSMDNMTATERFSKVGMDFTADANNVLARLYGGSYTHPVSDLRYGVDQPNPSQMPIEYVARNGLPVMIRLPPTTHYVTIQARLEDGTLSPVRRFDIPRGTRVVSR